MTQPVSLYDTRASQRSNAVSRTLRVVQMVRKFDPTHSRQLHEPQVSLNSTNEPVSQCSDDAGRRQPHHTAERLALYRSQRFHVPRQCLSRLKESCVNQHCRHGKNFIPLAPAVFRCAIVPVDLLRPMKQRCVTTRNNKDTCLVVAFAFRGAGHWQLLHSVRRATHWCAHNQWR
jgi:hypothetical protein